MITEKLATSSEVEAIEAEAQKAAEAAKDEAWQDYIAAS
jgi:hypothetical protein